MRMLLIGNPGNKRTAGLQAARNRLGLPPATVISYEALLQGHSLSELTGEGEAPALLRLDAPGELFGVERQLIALGAPDAAVEVDGDRLLDPDLEPPGSGPRPILQQAALQLDERRGELVHPSQWFRGYVRLLARLEREVAELWPQAKWVHAPASVALMFDKRRSHELLSEGGVVVPPRLADPRTLSCYEDVREAMRRERMPRIFLKLASGSGASGVLAYQTHPTTGAEVVLTTLGVENYVTRPPVYYNSRKLLRYTDPRQIRQLIDWVLRHGAHAERWIAKASAGNGVYDIRQLVVDGLAGHSIARISRTPITNLHLRNERLSLDELGMAPELRQEVAQAAEQAMDCFPNVRTAGVDVMVSRTGRVYVLEVNPFGDLLYYVLHDGVDPYEWQLRRFMSSEAREGEHGACPT
ncbi:STM4014 family protein [Paenibacillus daejeonensis]|uniref:STM4014 family protein n=1 Tax=Paenibacillus daejeonensis TaxID=135193 RepID=UPI0003707FB9|nr:STM4014 family protein [Paenibacillus daejeonensis]